MRFYKNLCTHIYNDRIYNNHVTINMAYSYNSKYKQEIMILKYPLMKQNIGLFSGDSWKITGGKHNPVGIGVKDVKSSQSKSYKNWKQRE